ncbi:MAG: Por secretion system protein [Prevotella sp.]|nr:Por secretion system protein [Prevotella sp.]
MKRKLFFSLIIMMVSIMAVSAAETPITSGQIAFPGADGYAKYTTGGRGGEVYYVTSLEDGTDSDVGTLRWAIRHDNGGKPRTILFKVGGTILLKSNLTFNYGDVSILGQTAPGGGICIAGYKFYINKDNVIVRYLRFRAGDLAGYMAGKSMASLDMENCKNVIVDHCSITWSMEECLTAYDSDYTTVQWSIIGEGLYNSMNAKGERSYATQWGGEHSTMHHCLITNCNNRMVRFNGVRNESKIGQGEHTHDAQVESEFANNVVFNWGKPNSGYGGEDNKSINNDGEGNHLGYNRVYMINNYYRPGPTTKTNVSSSRYFVQGDSVKNIAGSYGEWYLSGNKFEENSKFAGTGSVWSAANIAAVNADNLYGFASNNSARAFNMNALTAKKAPDFYERYVLKELPAGGLSGLEYETADEAFEATFAGAGARLPKLDAVDARLLKEAHGDIDPKYFGPSTAGGTTPARGIGIIDTPNDIDVAEYEADGYVTLTATAKADGSTVTNIYPDLSGTSTVVDTDGDGMPDTYEDNNGLDKNNAEDGALPANNGYSNLENFLNAVVDGTVNADGTPTAVEAVRASQQAGSDMEKVVSGSQVVIKKNGKTYNAAGQQTK